MAKKKKPKVQNLDTDLPTVKNTTKKVRFEKVRKAYISFYNFLKPIHWMKWLFLWLFAVVVMYVTFIMATDFIHTETSSALTIITNTADDTSAALLQSQLNERITLLVTGFGFVIGAEAIFFLKVFVVDPFIRLKSKIHNWLHML